MTSYRISWNLLVPFAFSFACCHSAQMHLSSRIYLPRKRRLFQTLYLEHLQVQMNFQSGHKGLHSESIRNVIINVRNEHFRWNSEGHKANLPEKDKPSHWCLRQGKHKEEIVFVYCPEWCCWSCSHVPPILKVLPWVPGGLENCIWAKSLHTKPSTAAI